jgi:hypothetical protein
MGDAEAEDEGTATGDKGSGKAPLAHRIARMMTTERDELSKAVTWTVAMTGEAVPDFTAARDLLDRLHRLIEQTTERMDCGREIGPDSFVRLRHC